MTSIKEELGGLKADLLSLQTFLTDKIATIETKINDIECKIRHGGRRDEPSVAPSGPELDNHTRNIIEELMWESTLSEGVLRVRELFKDSNSREKFVRCCLELVLEKDEQYRKTAGALFGNLISQNVINQHNVFNSLSSVLLVIENSNQHNCATKMWQNMTEILLPLINESHVKLLHLKRRAQVVLKADYYREFVTQLNRAIETSRKHVPNKMLKTSGGEQFRNNFAQSGLIGTGDKNDLTDMDEYLNSQHLYDLEREYKTTAVMDNRRSDDVTSFDVEQFVAKLTCDNLDDEFNRLKDVFSNGNIESILELIVDKAVQRESEQRFAVGTLFVALLSENVFDSKQLLVAICKSVFKLQTLVMNQNTRFSICGSFADLLVPAFTDGKIKFDQLSMIASHNLPDEVKTIFLWFVEKALMEKGGVNVEQQGPIKRTGGGGGGGGVVTTKLINRLRQYMGRAETEKRHEDDDGDGAVEESVVEFRSSRKPPIAEKREKLHAAKPEEIQYKPGTNETAADKQQTEHEKFLALRRKKLLRERMENAGEMEVKIDDLLNAEMAKKTEGEMIDPQQAIGEGGLPSKEGNATAPIKQPENLPSSAIKEKMEEIIEHLMESNNMDECISIVRNTFNECQSDLVFKAAFEYTKDKGSNYRIMSGTLVSEAFKHDPKRIGAQIMNTISLELGDFVDAPELWDSMAEIVSPPILNSLIRFNDLKLLPKYFLHTDQCASLLLAIFRQIIQQKGPDWLEENWKKSKLELSAFIPSNVISKFVIDNDLQFMLSEEELIQCQRSS